LNFVESEIENLAQFNVAQKTGSSKLLEILPSVWQF